MRKKGTQTKEKEMAVMEVSQAEMEALKAQRERKEAEAKAKEAQKKLEDAKKVEKMHEDIEKFKMKWNKHLDKVKEYLFKLEDVNPHTYEINVVKRTQNFEAYNYGETREILAVEEVAYDLPRIVYKDNPEGYFIEVEEHHTCGRHSHSFHSINNGLKMRISGRNVDYQYQNRFYTSAKKVNEKIMGMISRAKAKVERTKQTKDALTEAMEVLKKRYADKYVSMNIDEDGTRTNLNPSNGRYYRSQTFWKSWKVIKVVFKNGLTVTHTAGYHNDKLYLHTEKILYGELDKQAVVEALANVPTKSK